MYESAVLPNLNTLICSLHDLFHCKQRNYIKYAGKAELRIFKLLSAYIVEPVEAKQFVDILVPFLGNNVEHSGKFVHDLNAMPMSEMNELDYDTRISAYGSVNSGFFYGIRKDHALVILSQAVHDLSSEELIIRQNASRLLLSFIQFSAKVLGSDPMDCEETLKPMVESETNNCTKACVERIIKNFILKHMGEAMTREISVQREWIALLREMVLQLTELPSLRSIGNLASVDDAEKDFFHNILHLQKHRRAKALSHFRKSIVSALPILP